MRLSRIATVLAALSAAACSALVDFQGLVGSAASSDAGEIADGAVVDAGGTADAAAEASTVPACNPAAPFGAVAFLPPPVNLGSSNQYSGVLSADALTIYFCSDRGTAKAGGKTDLYVSHRASSASPWGPAGALDEIDTGANECSPFITSDELTLYFASDRAGGPGGSDLYVATRASVGDKFSAPALLPVSGSKDDDGPWLSADSKTLYFQAGSASSETYQLYQAPRSAKSFAEASQVPGLSSSSDDEGLVVTADGLTGFFGSTRGGASMSRLYVTHRTSVSDPFGMPALLSELAMQRDYAAWVSADGCTILVETYKNGPAQLYLATRGK